MASSLSKNWASTIEISSIMRCLQEVQCCRTPGRWASSRHCSRGAEPDPIPDNKRDKNDSHTTAQLFIDLRNVLIMTLPKSDPMLCTYWKKSVTYDYCLVWGEGILPFHKTFAIINYIYIYIWGDFLMKACSMFAFVGSHFSETWVKSFELEIFLPAKLCSVVPPMWQAATPVLAVAYVLFGGREPTILLSKKDFPVPKIKPWTVVFETPWKNTSIRN